MDSYTLGLDIGSNSLGWAIVNDAPSPNGQNLDTGVRVFPEGTENEKGTEKPRNLDRREARQARRQHDRRSRRRRKLRLILSQAGLLPSDPAELAPLLALDPYLLRRQALDGPLPPARFARALLHLNERRGFKSNAKAQGKEAKEQGKVKEEIAGLARSIRESGARTLGEYLAMRRENGEGTRRIYTQRGMFEEEFEALWQVQAQAHREIWTNDLKRAIGEKCIFSQRPLKPQAHAIGNCELEPDEKRCPRASWYAQQLRICQEINNLRVLGSSYEERRFSEEERERLKSKLMNQKSTVNFETIRDKILKLHPDKESLNFERTKRKGIQPNHAEAGLRAVFGKTDFADPGRVEFLRATVWETLVREDPDEFRSKARDWNLTDEQVEALFKIERPAGYAAYSLKAIRNLLPHVEAGKDLTEARKAAGYDGSGETAKVHRLPPLDPDAIRNPVVTRALSECRKVVNAIVREYGLPSRIVIEMARETKGTIASRQEQNEEMRKRERHNDEVREKLREMGIEPKRENVEKYKLWEECGGFCPYTGAPISPTQLYGDRCAFDVEHILPYPDSMDDGFMNKTLCAQEENRRRKHNRTPYDAYHGTPQYDDILQRVMKNPRMPYEKKKRFRMTEIPPDFTERQLRDTSYIARAARDYLRRLEGVRVDTTRGPVTAELRYQWGVHNILSGPDAEDRKKARDDHRQHAIDAVSIALTTPALVKALSRKYDFGKPECFPSPWEDRGIHRGDFRRMVEESVLAINVSHRPQRKVSGQINLETNYGKARGENQYVWRVPLSPVCGLTPAKAAKIVDPVVREIVAERLREHGIEPGKGSTAVPSKVFDKELRMKRRGDKPGPVIRRVRVQDTFKKMEPIADESGNPYRYVDPGSNHHVAIFEYADEKGRVRRCKELVTRFEAYRRLLKGESVVRRTHPDFPQARFLMTLTINDMVLIPREDGKEELYRVQKISGGESQEGINVSFRLHTAATIESEDTHWSLRSLSTEKFRVRKVAVDPLGRIGPAHD